MRAVVLPLLILAASCGSSGNTEASPSTDAAPVDARARRAIGEGCVPPLEQDPRFSQHSVDDLRFDGPTTECASDLCLIHYFDGRVSCPYGSEPKSASSPTSCDAVPSVPGLFTRGASPTGERCCPAPGGGEVEQPVRAQCSKRRAEDAVYCSCRCDVPNEVGIDRTTVTLCTCGEGFTCAPLCDRLRGNCSLVPKTLWGSYCVKTGPAGSRYDPAFGESVCAERITP